jgi:hypothetical protein
LHHYSFFLHDYQPKQRQQQRPNVMDNITDAMQQPTSSAIEFIDYFPTFRHVLNPYFTRNDERYLDVFETNVAPNTTILLYRSAVNSCLRFDLQINSTKDYVVARIISFKDDNIVVNVYDFFLDHIIHKEFGIQPMNSNDGACHNVEEVVQTLRRAVVPASAILGVAFIFTVNEITNGGISCQMIQNCFVVRFRYDYLTNIQHPFDCSRVPYKPSPVCYNHHYAPSIICKNYSPTMTCFVSSLWSNITIFQCLFFSALNKACEHQGSYSSFLGKVNIDVSFWKYIYNKTRHCVTPFVKPVNKKRSIILRNLT